MRDHLIAVVREIGTKAQAGDWWDIVQFGRDGEGHLWCGAGYFDAGGVLWWPPWTLGEQQSLPEQLSVEEGVDRFLKAYGLE
jgi:hypothetical protein